MRTTVHVLRTPNHNASEMKSKYDISHMIAAFHYEEVGVNDGSFERHENRQTFYKTHVDGNVFPSGILCALSQDLASMAGWKMGHDNKTAYMVVLGGEVAVFGFYDGKCTLVKWHPFSRAEVPHNIYKGRERVQKAYTEWRDAYLWAYKLNRQAEKARTYSPTGDKVYGKCSTCEDLTMRREMGVLVCEECATKCRCGSIKHIWIYEPTGEKMCAYCRADEERKAAELKCDKCNCGYDGYDSNHKVGDQCSWDECVGKLVLRHPPMQKARLDASGTAKGKTQIIAHHVAGECVLPGIGAKSYEVRELKN